MPRPSIIGGQGQSLVAIPLKPLVKHEKFELAESDEDLTDSDAEEENIGNNCCGCLNLTNNQNRYRKNSSTIENPKENVLSEPASSSDDEGAVEKKSHEEEWKSRWTLPQRKWVRRKYESFIIQVAVAGLIFLNFMIACIQMQRIEGIVPGSSEAKFFRAFEEFFAYIFLVELIVNMYGSWFRRFWRNPWNWFDFIIVIISLISLDPNANLPGISVLRLFRAFRVFRLFKRVPSLRIIIEGVGASIIGVSNAFMILGILMGIWAIIGVEFFGNRSFTIRSDTPSGFTTETPGEYFGTFWRAMYSLFQVMSMDSWCSNIARSITYGDVDNPLNYTRGIKGFENLGSWSQFPIGIYFISWIMVGGIIMMNVVVAVLLERYLEATKQEEEQIEKEEMIQCYTNKKEWKKVPHAQRSKHQYHEPAENKKQFLALEGMPGGRSKKRILKNLRIAKSYSLWDNIQDKELQHLIAVLWTENSKKPFMQRVLEKHKKESWVKKTNQPSFLLKTLLSGRGDVDDDDSDVDIEELFEKE